MRCLFAVLFCFLLISSKAYSQGLKFTEPDYESIKAAVFDEASSTYYPKLMKRYLAGDASLTADEFRLLYYGHIYQDNYNPYSPAMEHNALALYLEKEVLDEKDCDVIINYTNISMIDYPFNLHHLRMAVYAYHLKGDHKEADRHMKILNGVIDAILSSGDGKSMRTAFHVIYTPHEYEIVNILGYNAEYQTLNNIWDVISISKNNDKVPALYFNVGEMLDMYKKKAEKISSGRNIQ